MSSNNIDAMLAQQTIWQAQVANFLVKATFEIGLTELCGWCLIKTAGDKESLTGASFFNCALVFEAVISLSHNCAKGVDWQMTFIKTSM